MTTEIINEAICNNPGLLIDDLDLEGELINEHFVSPCVIHGGDRQTALNIYFNDYGGVRGRWICATRGCHKTFKNSIIGFVRGVLSHKYCRWTQAGDEIYNWSKTIKYLKELYGLDGQDHDFSEDREKKNFIRSCGYKTVKEKKIICTRDKYLWYYNASPDYYKERGFASKTLEKYDVRYCDSPNSKLYHRCCIPVYDEQNRNVIGISARTTCDEEPKWYNTTNFPASTSLYSYHTASEFIRRHRTAIIVEGPADVWRLNEAGIYNAVGIWGTELGEHKKYLLDKLGVMKLILALDNDEAGHEGMEKIIKDVERTYNTVRLNIPSEFNDIGELPVDTIKQIFKGEI